MRKTSILIASKDGMYNEALAAAFLDIDKSISVFTMPFKNIMCENMDKLSCYDVILLDEDSQVRNIICDNAVVLTEKKTASADKMTNYVYKYQKAENILDFLLMNFNKDSSKDINEGGGCEEIKNSKSDTMSVGMISVSEEGSCMGTDLLLAKTIARSGRRTVYFDMREVQRDIGINIKKEGSRTWDDLIYCCIYGKSENILSHPEDHASEEESGLMVFKGSKNRNPFYDLNDEEAEKFWRTIKEKLNSDIYLYSINYDNVSEIMKSVQYCNIIIISGNEKDQNACEELKKELTLNEGCLGEILTLCRGTKQKNVKGFDFFLDFDEGVSEDLLRLAGYIYKDMF